MHGEVGWPQDRRGAAVAADADADAVGAFVRVDACHDPVGEGHLGAARIVHQHVVACS